MPSASFISVDLPAPLCPTIACTTPGSSTKLTPWSTGTALKRISMSRISSAGCGVGSVGISGLSTPVVSGCPGDGWLGARRPPGNPVGLLADRGLAGQLRSVHEVPGVGRVRVGDGERRDVDEVGVLGVDRGESR